MSMTVFFNPFKPVKPKTKKLKLDQHKTKENKDEGIDGEKEVSEIENKNSGLQNFSEIVAAWNKDIRETRNHDRK